MGRELIKGKTSRLAVNNVARNVLMIRRNSIG
jgi:hypothetical protein